MLPARLVLIADRFTEERRLEHALAAVRGGIRWVHLRDHEAGPEAFDAAARTAIPRLRAAEETVHISVNARLNTAVDHDTSLHVGRRGPSAAAARPQLGDDALIGYSAHEEVEAEGELASQVDYFFFSPVYPTPSKPDHPGMGIPALRTFCNAARPTPVLALGGITPERVADCRAAGAYGVAVLSGIMEAPTPQAATRAYRRALAPA